VQSFGGHPVYTDCGGRWQIIARHALQQNAVYNSRRFYQIMSTCAALFARESLRLLINWI